MIAAYVLVSTYLLHAYTKFNKSSSLFTNCGSSMLILLQDPTMMSLLGDDASDISQATNTTTCSESSNMSYAGNDRLSKGNSIRTHVLKGQYCNVY